MMAVVTDNPNPGEQPEQNQPAPQEEPRLDPEQLRQFREFQRFQEYLRFTAANGSAQQGDEIQGNQIQPWTPPQVPVPAQETAPVPYRPAGPPDPPTPPTGNPQLHHQLAGMQQQLTELTETQRKAERAANPPLWRKILRNKWLHRLVALIVLLLVGSWAFNSVFDTNGSQDRREAGNPLPKSRSRQLPDQPTDTVHYLYELVASGRTQGVPQRACFVFTDTATSLQFARDMGAETCQDAIRLIAGEVTDPNAYANPTVPDSAKRGTPQQVTVSSCASDVSGGPRLGAFTLDRQQDGTWIISGHRNEPEPCPSASGSSGPPESTGPTTTPS
ncbi:MAG: hypothetical protein ACRDQ5_07660 [Sciscionella sp.]